MAEQFRADGLVEEFREIDGKIMESVILVKMRFCKDSGTSTVSTFHYP